MAVCPAAAVWAACTKSLHRAIYPEARQCRAEGSDSQRASGAIHRDALFHCSRRVATESHEYSELHRVNLRSINSFRGGVISVYWAVI